MYVCVRSGRCGPGPTSILVNIYLHPSFDISTPLSFPFSIKHWCVRYLVCVCVCVVVCALVLVLGLGRMGRLTAAGYSPVRGHLDRGAL